VAHRSNSTVHLLLLLEAPEGLIRESKYCGSHSSILVAAMRKANPTDAAFDPHEVGAGRIWSTLEGSLSVLFNRS
jgi:hypothetical protein